MLVLGATVWDLFSKNQDMQKQRFLKAVTLRTARDEASGKGFRIQTQGGKSNQDLLIFMKSDTWDSLQTCIFLE